MLAKPFQSRADHNLEPCLSQREKVDQHNTGNPVYERIERDIVERPPQSNDVRPSLSEPRNEAEHKISVAARMYVRYSSESGHQLSALGCPLCANSGPYAVAIGLIRTPGMLVARIPRAKKIEPA
jgi:hypothetical protein